MDAQMSILSNIVLPVFQKYLLCLLFCFGHNKQLNAFPSTVSALCSNEHVKYTINAKTYAMLMEPDTNNRVFFPFKTTIYVHIIIIIAIWTTLLCVIVICLYSWRNKQGSCNEFKYFRVKKKASSILWFII